ncbi:MAG: endonuclease [Moraxellaceae bacterium]|nr:endonuclease [Moraxellaceae bacterium]
MDLFYKDFNQRRYQMPHIFPNSSVKNRVIALTGLGTPKAFSAIISNVIPDIQLQANGQCFPLYLYEVNNTPTQQTPQGGLFDEPSTPTTTGYTRRDAITDAGLKHFTDFYQDQSISKEDLFYYIYGLLHSEEYKSKYADNLTKELPRIPRVKQLADFWAFSKAGRQLAELHINYETVTPYAVKFNCDLNTLKSDDFYVTQMKFAKGKNGEKHDKTSVVYNSKITLTGIPLQAYDYVVNGKPALEWVIERQAVSTHKDSGIINDANDWANETMHNPRYPLELFQRVITVSLETLKIVNGLPKLEIE